MFDEYSDIQDLDLGRFKDIIDRALLSRNFDGTYDYNGDLDFSNMELQSLTEIPIKFKKVNGFCSYYNNNLPTLKGSPKYVGDSFGCSRNQLITLVGAPNYVGCGFYCNHNNLTTLEGCPEFVGRVFWGKLNHLITTKIETSVIIEGTFHPSIPSLENLDLHISYLQQYSKERLEEHLNWLGNVDKPVYVEVLKALNDFGVDVGDISKFVDKAKDDDSGGLW